MQKILSLFFLVTLNCHCLGEDIEFAVGQEWTYPNTERDSESTLVIGAIQNHPTLGKVIHILIKSVYLPNLKTNTNFLTDIGHMPYSEDALRSSIRVLKATDIEAPSIHGGINEWERADGGVFTVPVKEAIQFVWLSVGGE